MNDSGEPKCRAHDLQPVNLFTDEKRRDPFVGRAADECDPDIIAVPDLSNKSLAIWQSGNLAVGKSRNA